MAEFSYEVGYRDKVYQVSQVPFYIPAATALK